MGMITDPINARRIGLHYNFCKTDDLYFDEWDYGPNDRTLRIAKAEDAINIVIKFDPTIQNSGAT